MDLAAQLDEINEINDLPDRDQRIAAYRAKIDSFGLGHPDRAEYLMCLAGDLVVRGDHDDARRVYRDAIADGGHTVLSPLCGLLTVEIETSDEAATSELLGQLMQASRADALVVGDYTWIGDTLEDAGRLREALRWFTIPLRDIQPGDLDMLPEDCLAGRFRVRRKLDLPLDAYDDAYEVWLEATQ